MKNWSFGCTEDIKLHIKQQIAQLVLRLALVLKRAFANTGTYWLRLLIMLVISYQQTTPHFEHI